MKFKWWFVDTIDQLTIKVDEHNIIQGELTALAIPLIDEEVLIVDFDTGMAVVVNHVGVLQHPDAIHQLLLMVR